ncbi:MAG TPA: hypothetical protein PK876_05715 [Elusimicrobiota bacterium]|nr:hypothetical protein [Elusimicrobiota bacterium]
MANNKGFFIFLLGRPGGGKSEIFRRISKKLMGGGVARFIERVDDFPKLWGIFQEDEKTGAWKHCRKTPDGGYKVTDNGVWDMILKQVNDDVLQQRDPDKVIFIEFARTYYMSALKNFSKDVLRNALIVYVNCSFETCWKRNVARHEAAVAAGSDDHLVSREEMEITYLNDDMAELVKKQPCPVVVVENERDGMDHLDGEIEKVIRTVNEFVGKRKGASSVRKMKSRSSRGGRADTKSRKRAS